MNVRAFGVTLWGDEPELPVADAVKAREDELERELIKTELDYIDMGARKEAIRAKIEYLRKYNQVDVPRIARKVNAS